MIYALYYLKSIIGMAFRILISFKRPEMPVEVYHRLAQGDAERAVYKNRLVIDLPYKGDKLIFDYKYIKNAIKVKNINSGMYFLGKETGLYFEYELKHTAEVIRALNDLFKGKSYIDVTLGREPHYKGDKSRKARFYVKDIRVRIDLREKGFNSLNVYELLSTKNIGEKIEDFTFRKDKDDNYQYKSKLGFKREIRKSEL